MPNKKTKDDLLAEKVSAEKKLEQYTHQLQRAVNREKYLVKGEAKKRTHIHLQYWRCCPQLLAGDTVFDQGGTVSDF